MHFFTHDNQIWICYTNILSLLLQEYYCWYLHYSIFKNLHKVKITNTQMFLQNSMKNNHKQIKTQHMNKPRPKTKKPIKFNLISLCNKIKIQTLKQWCLHLTLHLTSQLNNDVATYGVGIFVAHIGHLHKIHDLYNNKTYSWPKPKIIVTFVIMYRWT